MPDPPDLRDLERRPARYWNIDGIPELVMGLVWAVWGAALLAADALPSGPAANAYRIGMPALLVLSGFAANRAIVRLKQHVTYPRTGHVVHRPPTPRVRAAAALIALGSASLLAAMVVRGRAAGAEHTTAPIFGVLLSLAFVVASVRQGAPHLLALAGVALALGLAFAGLQWGWPAANWMFVWLGAASMAVGGLRLGRYLRQHPVEAHP